MATFRGSEYFCYDLSQNPIQSSSDEITLSFKTWQRNGLILHTGKSADYVNLALKDGAVSLVINLGSGAFEAIVEPVNGKFNDNAWHDVKVTRNLRQVTLKTRDADVLRFDSQTHRKSAGQHFSSEFFYFTSCFASSGSNLCLKLSAVRWLQEAVSLTPLDMHLTSPNSRSNRGSGERLQPTTTVLFTHSQSLLNC